MVSLDVRGSRVATDAWTRTSDVRAIDLAARLEDAGVRRFAYTDIARDGTMTAPNLEALQTFIAGVTCPVIASGGIGTPDDVATAFLAGADAVLAASVFHDGDLTVRQIKTYLSDQGLAVINPPIVKFDQGTQENFQESLDFGEPSEPVKS